LHEYFLWLADETTLRRRFAGISRCLSESMARTYTAPSASMPLFAHCRSPGMTNRNVLYLIIGGPVVALGVLGCNLYQAKKEPEGLQINVGPNGLKIQNK
jgi:hypothetical protein